MYQNAIYICISWNSNICWFPVKKCWCQQNSRDVSHDSYIFWIFFRYGITVPSFTIAGYAWQILEKGGLFGTPHPWAAPKKPILNRVIAKMKNRLSIKLCQKNLSTEKKYDELGKYSSISYVWENQSASSPAYARCGGNYLFFFI